MQSGRMLRRRYTHVCKAGCKGRRLICVNHTGWFKGVNQVSLCNNTHQILTAYYEQNNKINFLSQGESVSKLGIDQHVTCLQSECLYTGLTADVQLKQWLCFRLI